MLFKKSYFPCIANLIFWKDLIVSPSALNTGDMAMCLFHDKTTTPAYTSSVPIPSAPGTFDKS